MGNRLVMPDTNPYNSPPGSCQKFDPLPKNPPGDNAAHGETFAFNMVELVNDLKKLKTNSFSFTLFNPLQPLHPNRIAGFLFPA